jgi:uncharacterized membrane protein
MTISLEERLAGAEVALRKLERRVATLESTPPAAQQMVRQAAAPVRPVAPKPAAQPVARRAAPARSRQPKPEIAFEDLLGGRVLAWVGGLAVVLASSFFVVTAVHRGWIDVPTRIVLAFIGSALLVLAGAWLHERRGQTYAAQALVASGIASLYLSLVAATQLYHLVHPSAALLVAGGIGVVATTLAVRWSSHLIAALGIGGAVVSPVLVGAGTSTSALAFMAVALSASVAVLVWRAWTWLAVMTFVLSVPQLLAWVADEHEQQLGLTLAVLVLFWLLYLVAAAGFELRAPTVKLRVGAAMLLSLDSARAVATGWTILDRTGHGDRATAWVLSFAAVYLAIGGVSRLDRRINPDFGLAAIVLGLVYSAIGLALALDGPALVAGWAVEAAALAAIGRSRGDWRVFDASIAFLTLAVGHAIAFDAPPRGLAEASYDTTQALVAIAIVLAAAAALSALALPHDEGLERYADVAPPASLRGPLAALALGIAIYLLAYALDGTALVAALSMLTVALAAAGRLVDDRLVQAALAPLGVAAAHVLVFEAPPRALFLGVDDLREAVLSAAFVAVGAFAVGLLARDRELARTLLAAGGLTTLYLASVVIVDLWGVADDGDRLQAGQLALSVLWGATGIALLVVGLVRDVASLRRGGLALLVVAVCKVFTYDLSELTDLARVASLLAIGLVLIAAAYFYQRLRAIS